MFHLDLHTYKFKRSMNQYYKMFLSYYSSTALVPEYSWSYRLEQEEKQERFDPLVILPFFISECLHCSICPATHRSCGLQKILSRGWNNKLRTGRKYLQITYLTKNLYLEYMRNSLNSKKMKNSIRTWIKDLTRNVIKNQYTDNKKAHEKIFNIFSDKGKYKLNS